MQQLSGLDAGFLYTETPAAPMHVGSLVIYDPSTSPTGAMDYDEVVELFAARLRDARCFRQRLVHVPLGLDHPYWIEDPDFDLEFHLRHLALPRPGTWEQLMAQAARLFSRPLDMTRPLWEATVIEGVDSVDGVPEGSVAVATKIHHSAIDGMSGAEVFAAIHDLEPTPRQPEEDHWAPERPPATTELLTRATINNVTRPWRFVRTVGRSVPMLARAIDRTRRHEIEGPVAQAPSTRFNEPVSPNRVMDGRHFDLDDIKRIRRQVDGATVNDAVITIVGGALRAYLDGKGELPDDSLVSFAPISVRADDDTGEAGNKVSGMFTRLHTEIADPIERLEAVAASCRDAKSFHQTIGATTLTDYTEFGPMRLAGLAARVSSRTGLLGQIGLPVNCVVTNVPGPQFPLYLAGAKAVRLYGTAPIIDYLGLMHAIFSYDGGLTITFTACRRQMPDPAHYAECIQGSFDELIARS